MRHLPILLFLLITSSGFSQRDSVFISYPSTEDGLNTINGFLQEIPSGIAFLSYQFSEEEGYFSLIETDIEGNEIRRLDSIFVSGTKNSLEIKGFQKVSGGYLILSNLVKELKNNLFISLFVKDDFTEIEVRDTSSMVLSGDVLFNSVNFKLTPSGNFEAVGSVRNSPNDFKIIHVSVSPDGYFLDYNELDIAQKTFVIDFLRIESTNELLVSMWNQQLHVFDEDFLKIDSMRNIYESVIDGANFSGFYAFDKLIERDGKIFCSGDDISEDEYNMCLVEVSLNPLKIDTVYPALPKNVPWDEVVLAYMEEDQEGSFVLAGTAYFSIFFSDNNPNNLFITKYDRDRKQLWSFRIRDTRSLVVRDMHIDQNNDIILVGEYRDEGFESGERRNFLMKIYADGTLSSTTGPTLDDLSFEIFPNPTIEAINFELDAFKNSTAQIFSTEGKLLKTILIDSKTTSISVNDLSSGMYFLVIRDENGAIVKSSKFQKN